MNGHWLKTVKVLAEARDVTASVTAAIESFIVKVVEVENSIFGSD